ncbi:MAG: hypothetical protein ACLPUO_22395 [Streptosporangiaceae bacterium]
MAPLAVDPATLSGAGAAVISAGDGVAAATGTLTSGFGANIGQDAAGEAFALAYQDSAGSVLKAVAAGINDCRTIGFKLEVGASNYSRAEASSTLGGGGSVLPTPTPPGKFDAPGAPWTLGPGIAEPVLWGLVEEFVGDLWPNGNPAQIHAAATSWRSFGAALHSAKDTLREPISVVASQHIPESGLVQQAFSQLGDAIVKIGDECGKLAKGLDDFANEVQQAQNAIRDLLHRLDTPLGLLHEVVEVFKGHGLDEIKKIADDIKAVLHNMKREADAKEQLFQKAMGLMDSCAVDLEAFANKELTHFLGNDVGSAASAYFDTYVDISEGVLKGGADAAHALSQLNPLRFAYDPQGALHSWEGLENLAKMAANPAAIPAQLASDPKGTLDMVKGLVDYKDWSSDRPLVGLGHNLFDVGTAVLPGLGEVGAGTKAAETAGAATRVADAADVAGTVGRDGRLLDEAGEFATTTGTVGDVTGTASGLTKDLEKIGTDFPKSDPPPGGRPGALPPPKSGEPGATALPGPVEPTPTPTTSTPTDLATQRAVEHATTPTAPGDARSPISSGQPAPVSSPGATAPGGVHEPAPAFAGPQSIPSVSAPTDPLPSYGAVPAPHAPAAPESGLASAHSPQPPPPPPHQMPLQDPHSAGAHPLDPPPPADAWPPGGGANGYTGEGGGRGGMSNGGDGHSGGGSDGGVRDGHTGGADGHGDDSSSPGLTDEKRDEILAMEKGTRPDPSEYLSPEYIEHHLEQFNHGGTRFMLDENLKQYGISQRDGTTFLFPTSEVDPLLAKGDFAALESALGLPQGYFKDYNVIRVDIPHPDDYNLRMPSGNEAGANEYWLPGGHLPEGMPEAVIDGSNVPPEDLTIIELDDPGRK